MSLRQAPGPPDWVRASMQTEPPAVTCPAGDGWGTVKLVGATAGRHGGLGVARDIALRSPEYIFMRGRTTRRKKGEEG